MQVYESSVSAKETPEKKNDYKIFSLSMRFQKNPWRSIFALECDRNLEGALV